MRSETLGLMLLGSLAAGTGAIAQPMPAQPGNSAAPSASAPAATAPRAGTTASTIVEASALEAGANSFTEDQARGRFEAAGFTAIQGLAKDASGFWRGRGMRNGAASDIAMDFQGRIAAGPGVATLGARNPRADSPSVSPTTAGITAPRDGTPGNPPSTMGGRAADRLQGEMPRADGTPVNPPGTALGRATGTTTTLPR